VVDTLGGIDIQVPMTLIDNAYPVDRNGTYTTFRVNSGQQVMDGATALKYARSRHSTSDFSRSSRQHDVIKAIMDKFLKTENVTNISVLRELYSQYTKIVTTNISYQEMLGMVSKLEDLDTMISNGLTSECGYG
jgi:anionic cell wall polymer biosynthesis LytR-Cps2A-Psr (LCP) family protein